MNRRQFATRGALAVVGASALGYGRCDSATVSVYVRTITTFLNKVSGLLPDRATVIAKIVKTATDFEAAYKRGDFSSADNFFNSLDQNLTAFTNDLGVNVSNNVKTWISIVGATVTSLAVLFKGEVNTSPALESIARNAKSARAVERLASQAAVDALYQAAKPK